MFLSLVESLNFLTLYAERCANNTRTLTNSRMSQR